MKIWLVGMMGSGKTSAGTAAASALDVPFIDTDQMVVDKVGRSIAELWSEEGEEVFRSVETAIVAEVEALSGIVATGGGVVLAEQNRDILSRSGTVVWLHASPEVLAARLAGTSDRPLLDRPGDEVSVLLRTLNERLPLYAEVADHTIETDHLDTDAIAGRIESLWKS